MEVQEALTLLEKHNRWRRGISSVDKIIIKNNRK